MSEEDMKQQLEEAIRDYAAAKERLKCLEKRLEDFRGAASRATTAASPGGIRRTVAQDWKYLLNGEDFAALVGDFFDTKEQIERLGEYLSARGYAGLVS